MCVCVHSVCVHTSAKLTQMEIRVQGSWEKLLGTHLCGMEEGGSGQRKKSQHDSRLPMGSYGVGMALRLSHME
jgi:hypothetical protein